MYLCDFCQSKFILSGKMFQNVNFKHYVHNYRNVQQVEVLGRQLGKGSLLKEAYLDAISKPYGYLVVDLNPRVSDAIQLRTNIFPDEQPVVVYKVIGSFLCSCILN